MFSVYYSSLSDLLAPFVFCSILDIVLVSLYFCFLSSGLACVVVLSYPVR